MTALSEAKKLRRRLAQVPALPMRCERLRCTTTTAVCATRWVRSQSDSIWDEAFGACKGCPIGKKNARH